MKIMLSKMKGECYLLAVSDSRKELQMRLGVVIRSWRERQGLGLRAVAEEIGTSPATLSRLELGDSVDGTTMIKVLLWLIGKEGK